jgi:two-component system, NarL family, sensor kinase
MITAIISGTIVLLTLVLFIIFFVLVHYRKQAISQNIQKQMQSHFQQELLRTQIEIQEQTLKTISQEIHDNVGQVLSLAKLNLATFPTLGELQSNKINDTKNLVSKAIIDLRNLSRSMFGDQLQEMGLAKAIDNELSIVHSTGLFDTSLSVGNNVRKLEPQIEIVLFRMVQEAINNIIKHAKATRIHIDIGYEPNQFHISINDNGKGFDLNNNNQSSGGMGLKSIQNRAALIGATFNIESDKGKGTTLSLHIPNPVYQT